MNDELNRVLEKHGFCDPDECCPLCLLRTVMQERDELFEWFEKVGEAFGPGVKGERAWKAEERVECLMDFARKAAAKFRGFECKDCGLTHECARKASGHDCSLAELVCEAERLGLQ